MKIRVFILAGLLAMQAIPLRAGGELTLEQAVDRALRANHMLLGLTNDREIARLDFESARSVYRARVASHLSSDARSGAEVGSVYSVYLDKENPSGSGYRAGYYNSSFGNRNLSELRFSYTLPFFNNPLDNQELAIDQAEINLARSRRTLQIGREELVNQVVTAYYRLAMALQSEALAQERMLITSNLFEAQQIRQRNGEISDLELSEAGLALADRQRQFEDARFERMQREDTLKLLIGMSADERVAIDAEALVAVDDSLLSTPLEELQLRAVNSRTELIAKHEELQMTRRRIRSHDTGPVPPIEISLQYALVGEGDRFGDTMEFDDQRFGIGLRMDTDFGVSEARLKQNRLRLRYQSLQRELVWMRERIKMEVRSAWFRATRAMGNLEFARRNRDFMEKKHRQATILHGRGELTELELLESGHRVADARYQALAAKVDAILAQQALAMASGFIREGWQ